MHMKAVARVDKLVRAPRRRAGRGNIGVQLLLFAALLLQSRAFVVRTQADPTQDERDIETIKQRLRAALLPTDPAVIAERVPIVRHLMQTLQADGSWSDIDYRDQNPNNWLTVQHLARVVTMAKMYLVPNQELFQDADLLARTLAALDFWLNNDFQNPNWWHNLINVPRLVGQAFILLEAELTPEQFRKGIVILQRSTLENATGANLTWQATNILMRGSLLRDADTVAQAANALLNEIRIAELEQEGIQADFSFHQHGALLYSGGYGVPFTQDTADAVWLLSGTRFAASAERAAILFGHVLDGQQWMMRGIMFDYSAVGRQITRPGNDGRLLLVPVRRLAGIPGPRQPECAAFAARLQGDPAAPPLLGNRHFWRSDYMVHQRPAYFVSVRMFSTRTFNTDGYLNGEGRNTNHLADGATFIYRSGEEYRDVFPVWDWRRVPGITCEQSPEPLDLAQLHIRGQSSFVGGVSDGTYGLAAMDLQRPPLSAKKAWICFDEEMVCLGAGINCSSANPVTTAVNQCLRNDVVTVIGPSHWSRSQGMGEHVLLEGGLVHHDGVGYVFPEATRLVVQHGPQRGRWSDIGAGPADEVTKEVFSLWIDHGVQVADASYVYSVVPAVRAEELAARAISDPVELLSNTAQLQAVRHNDLRALGAAFYQPGTLNGGPGWTISVDKPCLLFLREQAAGVRLAVANPENQPLNVAIEIDRTLTGAGTTPLDGGRTRISVALPAGLEAGRSVVVELL